MSHLFSAEFKIDGAALFGVPEAGIEAVHPILVFGFQDEMLHTWRPHAGVESLGFLHLKGKVLLTILHVTTLPRTEIVGGVFVWEAASVMIQVSVFKYTKRRSPTGEGKRFFLMAPIHHHFQKKGWPETKVVLRFWVLSLIFALVGLGTLKLR